MAEESEPQASSDPRARRHRRLFFGSIAVGALLLIAACTPVKPPAGDTTPPPAPTIDLDEASDGGPPHDDNITNVTTPTFVGMAEAGATVRLLDGLTDVGVGAADGAGTYSITSTELAPGSHDMRALAIDAANNQSEPSTLLVVMIDITPPATAPSTPDLTTAHDSGVSNTDNVTKVDHPTFTGTATAGLHVRLFSGGTQLLGTATADGRGDWSIQSTPDMLDGVHSVTATQTDAAGNASAPSGTLNVTIDTVAPAVTLNNVADPSPTTPVLTGAAGIASGDANTVTVEVYLGTEALGTPVVYPVTPSGSSWEATPDPLTPTAVYTVRATQSDVAGNTGTSSIDTFTVDTAP